MAFPVRMISEMIDTIEMDVDETVREREFEDWMNMISITSDVDCYIKLNSHENKPIPILSSLVFNFFFPVKKIIAWTTSGRGKIYIWGEKI